MPLKHVILIPVLQVTVVLVILNVLRIFLAAPDILMIQRKQVPPVRGDNVAMMIVAPSIKVVLYGYHQIVVAEVKNPKILLHLNLVKMLLAKIMNVAIIIQPVLMLNSTVNPVIIRITCPSPNRYGLNKLVQEQHAQLKTVAFLVLRGNYPKFKCTPFLFNKIINIYIYLCFLSVIC
jgi:hypothetical protein